MKRLNKIFQLPLVNCQVGDYYLVRLRNQPKSYFTIIKITGEVPLLNITNSNLPQSFYFIFISNERKIPILLDQFRTLVINNKYLTFKKLTYPEVAMYLLKE